MSLFAGLPTDVLGRTTVLRAHSAHEFLGFSPVEVSNVRQNVRNQKNKYKVE